jgi:hypothetical protein
MPGDFMDRYQVTVAQFWVRTSRAGIWSAGKKRERQTALFFQHPVRLKHDQEKHVLAKAGMDAGFPEKSCENKRI